MRLLLILLILTSSTLQSAEAQTGNWSVLLSPSELETRLEQLSDIRLIQITGNYEEGHINGTVNAPYALFRGPQNNAGQLPQPDELQALIRSLGIERETPVVIVHQGSSASDMGAATRVYWTLKSASIQQLAILNGGLNAWREAGHTISTEPVAVKPSNYTLQWRDDWRITTEQLALSLDEPTINLVDARPADFYFGRQYSASRPGTIKNAENISFDQWFSYNEMKSPDALRHLVQDSGLDSSQQQVNFCNTGHWGSINWFVMSEIAGLPDTRLYAESVSEWSEQALPMDNQPGRLQHYWNITRNWFISLVEG